MSKKVTKSNLAEVLMRLHQLARGEAYACMVICDSLDDMLDTLLLKDDFFGTEGQLDPRGDHAEFHHAAKEQHTCQRE